MLDSEVAVSVDVAMPAIPGVRYVCDDKPAIRRRRAGKSFVYLDAKGRRIAEADILRRIRSLVIPPAWTDVWIYPAADGLIQATGRDARGRKQYSITTTTARRGSGRSTSTCSNSPRRCDDTGHCRRRYEPPRPAAREGSRDGRAFARDNLIRVGNGEYAKTNQSYGLTTLLNEHVEVDGSEIRFCFTGKSGKQWSLATRDRRVARILRACQELPGQELLQYFDDDRELRGVSSGDVNAYLKEIAGRDITAKDFRTWAGTLLMARFLRASGQFENATKAKRLMSAAVKEVAAALGNTPAVCRKSYIHPAVAAAYLGGGCRRPGKSSGALNRRA